MVRENQAVAYRKEGGLGTDRARLIQQEKPSPNEDSLMSMIKQEVKLGQRYGPLQQKKVNRRGQRISDCQFFQAVNREGTPP